MKKFAILLFCVLVVQTRAEVLSDEALQELIQVGLPVVQIFTVDGEEPTADPIDAPEGLLGGTIINATKVPGRVIVSDYEGIIYDSGDYEKKESGMTVKLRGNWSARRPKAPFKIKLQRKGDMLGRGDSRFMDKNWLLMPFFEMNYFVGLKVNELMGLQWTPQYRYVNLVFNGDFRGLYMLMEAVERNSDCRLDVDKKTGFIVELDAYWWKEDVWLPAPFEEPLAYTFKYPDDEDVTEEQLAYIGGVLSAAEESMLDSTYTKHIDIDSFARWILAHDILGNKDGAGANMFLTKYDDTDMSLLKMGCMWDFDVIMQVEGWDEMHDRYYFHRLFNNSDRTFSARYVTLWNELKDSVFNELIRYLDNYLVSDLRQPVDASIRLNNDRWARLMYSLPLSEDFIEEARAWFTQRREWLDHAIEDIPLTASDPSGHHILVEVPWHHTVYDLFGRRLSGLPQKSGLYIVDGRKVVYKIK